MAQQVDREHGDDPQQDGAQGDGQSTDPPVLLPDRPFVELHLRAQPVNLRANEVGIPGKDPKIIIQGHIEHLAHGPGEIDGGGMGLAGEELGQRGGGDPGLVGDGLDGDAALVAAVSADIVEGLLVR